MTEMTDPDFVCATCNSTGEIARSTISEAKMPYKEWLRIFCYKRWLLSMMTFDLRTKKPEPCPDCIWGKLQEEMKCAARCEEEA